MSIISAGTTTTTALVQTGDTTGSLVLQTGSPPTTAMTISSSQIVDFANAPTVAGGALSATNLSGGAAGKIPFQTGSSTTSFTAAGTSGQVLTSAGTGTPTWTTPSSGAMTLISTQTASASASLSWTGLSGYTNYLLIVNNLVFSANGTQFCMQIGNPTYITSGYYISEIYQTANTVSGINEANNSFLRLNGGFSFDATVPCSGTANIFNMLNASGALTVNSNMTVYDGGIKTFLSNGQATSSSGTYNAIKIYPSSGNFTSGTASLYGISS